MGKQGKTIGGGIPGPGKVISGGHGMGKYGQPHKFYDKGMAKYKGPHKQLEDLSGDGKITQKDVLIGRGVLEGDKGPKKMSGESYDMKQAYNKNLTEGARFNYLKNALHDKGGMSKYKSDAQRKAVHASKAEQGPGKMKEVKSVKAGNLKSYDLPGHGEVINKRIYMDPKNIKAKVLGGPNKMKKDKQKISKLQDDVLAGAAKYKYGKK